MQKTSETLPKSVLLREEGPREGFQIHPTFVPTKQKLELISALVETGISTIEVTAFVREDKVPQHKDAETLAAALTPNPSVRYRALYLNRKGLERALLFHPVIQPEGIVLTSPSEPFLKANNNQTIEQNLAQVSVWCETFQNAGLRFERLMVSNAFGDKFIGITSAPEIVLLCKKIILEAEACGMKVEEVTLADTTGFANPNLITSHVQTFRAAFPDVHIGLHLHDTRGTGMANVYAGLLAGVTRFDCSVAGLGGCPFTPGAAGNVPTEDVAFLCEELGISTGVNLERYIEAALLAEKIVGHPLPGKLKNGKLPKR